MLLRSTPRASSSLLPTKYTITATTVIKHKQPALYSTASACVVPSSLPLNVSQTATAGGLVVYPLAWCLWKTLTSRLFDTFILWAAPKKKTTHSKKRKRMASKWPTPLRNIIACPVCGTAMLNQHICKTCAGLDRRQGNKNNRNDWM